MKKKTPCISYSSMTNDHVYELIRIGKLIKGTPLTFVTFPCGLLNFTLRILGLGLTLVNFYYAFPFAPAPGIDCNVHCCRIEWDALE